MQERWGALVGNRRHLLWWPGGALLAAFVSRGWAKLETQCRQRPWFLARVSVDVSAERGGKAFWYERNSGNAGQDGAASASTPQDFSGPLLCQGSQARAAPRFPPLPWLPSLPAPVVAELARLAG